MERQEGAVKVFYKQKGFGFISVPGRKDELFFHFSEIQMDGFKSVEDGQAVSFEEGVGPQGKPQAQKVRVIS